MAEYHHLLRVANGNEPADLVIRGGLLINVVTREIHPAVIGLCEDQIAYVTDSDDANCAGRITIDATGMWIAPGLIDSHMHIESSHLTPPYFAEALLPRGITTVAQDPHEIANVLGLDGVTYMRRASAGLPLRVLTFAPTCVPAVPGLETSGASFGVDDILSLLDEPDVIGLAEMMDYWGVIRQSERPTEIVKAGRAKGTILTGHIRGLSGRQLNTYLAAGVDSDHERLSPEGILARTRLGMTVEIVCCIGRDNIAEAVALWKQRGHLENVVFVTDDIPPEELLEQGHLDRAVRRAIALGMAPVDAVRAASLAPARRLRKDDLGQIAPGRKADLLILDDLADFHVHQTIAGGQVVAVDGRMVAPVQHLCQPPETALNSVHLAPFEPGDFDLAGRGSQVRARVITRRGRGLEEQILAVTGGEIDWQSDPNLVQVSIWHRHGRDKNHFACLLSGSGLRRGALATTYSHDSHNLLVLGRSPADIALAANTLRTSGGGYVAVADGQVLALAALPVAGLLADCPLEQLGAAFRDFRLASATLGIGEDVLSLLSSLPLPVVPSYRPTDLGLVDVDRQEFIEAFEFIP